MDKKVVFFIFVSVLAGLNLGSIRKAEDPIRDTQTNPILYEQKKEEEKDGKKGPLLYHVRNNLREAFFIDPPFEAAAKQVGAVGKEPFIPATAASADNAGWWEEQLTGTETVPLAETAAEPLPEPSSNEENVRDLDAPEQPAAGAENAPSGKGDDYWW